MFNFQYNFNGERHQVRGKSWGGRHGRLNSLGQGGAREAGKDQLDSQGGTGEAGKNQIDSLGGTREAG